MADDNGKGSGKQDKDQSHSESSAEIIVNDINKIESRVESMLSTLTNTTTCVELIDTEWQTLKKSLDPVYEFPSEKPQEISVEVCLPSFPKTIDSRSFKSWLEATERKLESSCIPEVEEVRLVLSKLPRKESKWLTEVIDLNNEADKEHPIEWRQMKKLLMFRFISQLTDENPKVSN